MELSLDAIIDETLVDLYGATEFPQQVVCQNGIDNNDTTLTLVGESFDGTPAAVLGDVLEFGTELILVVDASSATDTTLVVQRGHRLTTPAAIATSDVGYLNPRFPRSTLKKNLISQVLPKLDALCPNRETAEYVIEPGRGYVELEANTISVDRVRYQFTEEPMRIVELPGWEFHRDMPNGTGKYLAVSGDVTDDDTLIVTRNFSWKFLDSSTDLPVENPDGADYLLVEDFMRDIPSLYLKAYTFLGRQVGRAEVDRLADWDEAEAQKRGVDVRTLQMLWTELYARVDEVKGLRPRSIQRHFRKMPTSRGDRKSVV